MVKITINHVTDPDGGHPTIEILSIRRDEVTTHGGGDGNTGPDGTIAGHSAWVRAERSNTGNGRVYHIRFRATDSIGASCEGEVLVGVPLYQNHPPVDGGPLYDSTN